MKNFIKSVFFIIIFFILFHIVFSVLWVIDSPITYFYDEKENSLDVVYVGSSNAYVHFNPTLAFDKYGFTTGFMSSDTMPFSFTKYAIIEAEKYQTPQLYVIDIARVIDPPEYFSDTDIRKSLDTLRFSQNRKEAVDYVLKYQKMDKSQYINYYFSFLIYHNKWKSISIEDFTKRKDLFKGYLFSGWTTVIEKQEPIIWPDEITKMAPENEEVLLDLLEYIEDNQINALFILPNNFYYQYQMFQINDAIRIIGEHGYKVINYEKKDKDIGLDYSTDFYNRNHLNVWGSTKFTLDFARYLNNHYDLPNHKNDKNYSSWEKAYLDFKNYYKLITDKDFDDLLE